MDSFKAESAVRKKHLLSVRRFLGDDGGTLIGFGIFDDGSVTKAIVISHQDARALRSWLDTALANE